MCIGRPQDHDITASVSLDVINERNDLLRQVELLKQRIDELTNQYGKLWKVEDPK